MPFFHRFTITSRLLFSKQDNPIALSMPAGRGWHFSKNPTPLPACFIRISQDHTETNNKPTAPVFITQRLY
ncbi:Lon-like protease helical domain-containing protein [Terrimonas ferruginea]|uniref:Lon-like protease helical domain-containing protein n=1 Tax=Terrimonas ferruginea TaxID=249 RepID=UPI0034E97AB5